MFREKILGLVLVLRITSALLRDWLWLNCAHLETQLDEHQKQHDAAEEELRIELEHEKSNNDALSSELKELKEKMTANEAAAQTENEVSIKSELNTFESLLECEGESTSTCRD